jgi:hypothetical protein
MVMQAMKFNLTELERNLPPPPLDADGLRNALGAIREDRIGHFIQAYVRDRVPAAFNSCPLLWESARRLICDRVERKLGVRMAPIEVGLTGSANLGFSPVIDKWGKPYGAGSDLDLFLVNDRLFELVQLDSARFLKTDDSRFVDQREAVERQLSRGFVSTWLVPASREHYKHCTELRSEAAVLIDRLNGEGMELKRSFYRVFSGWPALAGQLQKNFAYLKRELLN